MASGTPRDLGLHIGGLELTLAWDREESLEFPAWAGAGGAMAGPDQRVGCSW